MVDFALTAADAAAQLDADLIALGDGLTEQEMGLAVAATPSVLRRVAARVARLVDPGTDRVCAAGPADAALAIAVSLHTGVPAALFDAEGDALSEIHAGERLLVVSVLGGAGPESLADALTARGHATVAIAVALEGAR